MGVISCLLVYTLLKFVDTLLIFHEGNQTRHWGFSATKSWAFSCDLLVISIFKIKLRAQNTHPRLWFHRFSAVYRHPKLRKEIFQLSIKFLATFVVFERRSKRGGGGKGRGNEYYACLRSFLVWETVFAHKRSCWLVRFSSTCQSLAKLLHDYLAGKTKESELVQRRSCQFRFRSRGSSLEKPNFFLSRKRL